jgi:hypothetical protein
MIGPVYAHACAVRQAKSANLIGGAPVTFWTLSLGREPIPRRWYLGNIRSISAYSARTPAATLLWIHTSRSMSARWVGYAIRAAEDSSPSPLLFAFDSGCV